MSSKEPPHSDFHKICRAIGLDGYVHEPWSNSPLTWVHPPVPLRSQKLCFNLLYISLLRFRLLESMSTRFSHWTWKLIYPSKPEQLAWFRVLKISISVPCPIRHPWRPTGNRGNFVVKSWISILQRDQNHNSKAETLQRELALWHQAFIVPYGTVIGQIHWFHEWWSMSQLNCT
jgi:hypothetical protein